MRKFSPPEIEHFLIQFKSFYDSLIKQITIKYGKGEPDIEILLNVCYDTKNNAWGELKLILTGSSFFKIPSGNAAYDVLSDGISIGYIDDCYFIAFEETSKFSGIEDAKRENFIFLTKNIYWDANFIEG